MPSFRFSLVRGIVFPNLGYHKAEHRDYKIPMQQKKTILATKIAKGAKWNMYTKLIIRAGINFRRYG